MNKICIGFLLVASLLLGLGQTGCFGGGGSSSSTSPTLGAEATGAAISALFSGSANQNVSGLVRYLDATRDICENLSAAPGKVLVSGRAAVGTYGAEDDTVTLVEDDFCQSADGEDQTSDSDTPGTRFAQFTFLSEVIGSCTTADGDESTITMVRGSGVVRNTDSYFPEIYGAFEIGGQVSQCTLRIDSNGQVAPDVSSCTTNGQTTAITSDLSCALDAGIARYDLPELFEGHAASTQSSTGSISAGCSEIYPLQSDDDGFTTISSDCENYDSLGFNAESLTVNIVVSGNSSAWEFHYVDGDVSNILNQAKIFRLKELPVFLQTRLVYSETFDGTNPNVIDPYADFPQTLVDNSTFQSELATELVNVANAAEHANIELLAPLSGADHVFANSTTPNAASTYVQNILNSVADRFSGSLVAVFDEFENDDTSRYDLADFDFVAVNVSPRAADTSLVDFQNHLGGQLTLMKSVANQYDVPYFIAGVGIWDDATDSSNTFDWDASSERIIDVFEEAYGRSSTFETSGVFFKEGFSGDVLFSGQSELQDYIASIFEPVILESDVDGEYDPALTPLTLTWDLMNGPTFNAKGMTMAAYSGKLYVFGGSSTGAGERTQIYNIATNTWSLGANMPRYRESANAVELNGLIYVLGGNDPDTCGGNYRCAQLAEVDVYNPSTNSWNTADSLNERRDVAGAVAYDGKIYVVGGMYSESGDIQVSNRNSLEVYDPDSNNWSIVNTDIPYPVRSAATAIQDGIIYVVGGCAEHGADMDELEASNTCSQTLVQTYDILNDTWAVLENNMPTGRHFSGQHIFALDVGFLVFGGSTDLGHETFATVEAFNFSSQTWTYATDMQIRRKSAASASYNGYVYVVGGAGHGYGYTTAQADSMERVSVGGL